MLEEGILTNEQNPAESEDKMHHDGEGLEEVPDQPNHAMTPEELLKMRMEILPQLLYVLQICSLIASRFIRNIVPH